MSDRELLEMIIRDFSARIIASWTPEEWAGVLAQIQKNRGRYGMGQWV
jgi:hypothetical protein